MSDTRITTRWMWYFTVFCKTCCETEIMKSGEGILSIQGNFNVADKCFKNFCFVRIINLKGELWTVHC